MAMIQVMPATFEHGVFKPDQQPALAESTRVRLLIETMSDDTNESLRQRAWASLQQLCQQSTFDSHGYRLSREQLHERR